MRCRQAGALAELRAVLREFRHGSCSSGHRKGGTHRDLFSMSGLHGFCPLHLWKQCFV